jgi:hypothetical protein
MEYLRAKELALAKHISITIPFLVVSIPAYPFDAPINLLVSVQYNADVASHTKLPPISLTSSDTMSVQLYCFKRGFKALH